MFTHKAKVVGKALLGMLDPGIVRLCLFHTRHAPPCEVNEAASLIRQAVLAGAVSKAPIQSIVLEACLCRMVGMLELKPTTASLRSASSVGSRVVLHATASPTAVLSLMSSVCPWMSRTQTPRSPAYPQQSAKDVVQCVQVS